MGLGLGARLQLGPASDVVHSLVHFRAFLKTSPGGVSELTSTLHRALQRIVGRAFFLVFRALAERFSKARLGGFLVQFTITITKSEHTPGRRSFLSP